MPIAFALLAGLLSGSFLNQKTKATDASAKELARSAQTASETYATDHSGSYAGLSATALHTIEPSIGVTASSSDAYLSAAAPSGTSNDGFTVTATATSGNTYTITRASDGSTTRSCTVATAGAGSGGCVANSW